ncbi:RNA polymerase sigma factor CnrH [Pirellulimonas nuda]|uniref:RNA polymerase sigma factor CnrH n=1 Tax=Pirellulimonas nuda TaxID=2528009 RepID=A0A518DDS8_9BACT|nr:sigma-70 family RNA polymerase sigma factor [Pirellulimonas nuda]QDU89627.1 RNA polymerase sigma factor CnrH [Pirellulimonas nuda]
MASLARLWADAEPAVRAYVGAELRNPHDTDDVVQEVGRAVTQSIDRYDPDRPFSNWIFGVARLQVLQFYRRRSIERTTFSSELVDQLASAYQALTPTISARREALDACVESLAPRQREVLRCYYADQTPHAEIGERLGMSKAAVSVMLHRLRIALRDCVRRRLGNQEAAT